MTRTRPADVESAIAPVAQLERPLPRARRGSGHALEDPGLSAAERKHRPGRPRARSGSARREIPPSRSRAEHEERLPGSSPRCGPRGRCRSHARPGAPRPGRPTRTSGLAGRGGAEEAARRADPDRSIRRLPHRTHGRVPGRRRREPQRDRIRLPHSDTARRRFRRARLPRARRSTKSTLFPGRGRGRRAGTPGRPAGVAGSRRTSPPVVATQIAPSGVSASAVTRGFGSPSSAA